MASTDGDDVDEGTFATSTGVCRVTSEAIILERRGWRGRLAEWFVGDSVGLASVWYAVAGLGLVGWGLYDLMVWGTPLGWLPLSFGIIALLDVALSRDASAATEISCDTVERVVPGSTGVTAWRHHFMVYFRDDGETRRRIIMLPSLFGSGREAFDRGIELFRRVDLLEED